jgi:hypothetical protein
MGKVFIPLGYFVKSSTHWSYGSVVKALLAVLGLAVGVKSSAIRHGG